MRKFFETYQYIWVTLYLWCSFSCPWLRRWLLPWLPSCVWKLGFCRRIYPPCMYIFPALIYAVFKVRGLSASIHASLRSRKRIGTSHALLLFARSDLGSRKWVEFALALLRSIRFHILPFHQSLVESSSFAFNFVHMNLNLVVGGLGYVTPNSWKNQAQVSSRTVYQC